MLMPLSRAVRPARSSYSRAIVRGIAALGAAEGRLQLEECRIQNAERTAVHDVWLTKNADAESKESS
jgi:hypothetical protein